MRRSKRLLFVAVPAAVLVATALLAFFSAQRALTSSAEVQRTAGQLPFAIHSMDLDAAKSQLAAFEPVAATAAFSSGVFLDRDLYLAGPAGLSIYNADGTLLRSLRTGVDLPVEPIVAVAAGRLRGASDAEILLATAGAGLLRLAPAQTGPPRLQQVLTPSAQDRDLTALLPLPSGDLLLGTRHGGVLLYNGATLTRLRFSPQDRTDPATLDVTALAALDAATILIGTRNAGVFYLHGGTVEHATVATGLPDSQVDALLISGRKAYAGTPLGVAEFDLDSGSFRPARVIAAGLFSHALAIDSSTRELAVGTLDQGIQRVALDRSPRLRNISITAPNDAAEATTVQRIDGFIGAPGGLFAIADGTLIRRSGTGWSAAFPSATATLTDRNISALAFAPDGSLYVGYFDHGLDILPPGGGAIRHLEDDHLFCIDRLAVDPVRQTIAAATANGLVLFDRQGVARQVLTRRDGLISDHVNDIAFTRGGLTVATPAGLTFLGATGAESLYAFQGLVNNHVYALGARADSDLLLAGTLGGISLLQAGSVRRNLTATNSGLGHNWVTAILPMASGGYLIGTYGAGIQRMSAHGEFSPIELPAGMPHDLVINPNAIFATQDHVFAGTLNHGLLVFSNATGRWSNVTRGLPSLNTTAFAARDGEVYIGTENGLVQIAESQLEAQRQ